MSYTLYIDESGDSGVPISSSPYFTLGAVLIENKNRPMLETRVSEISEEIRGNKKSANIHFSQMKHLQRAYVCREFSKLPLTCFGLISRKATLGGYADQINQDNVKFYNKNIGYLLEIIGIAFKEFNIAFEEHEIVLEEMANFPYGQLRNYIKKCRDTPYHNRAAYLENINPQRIKSVKKSEDTLLSIADCMAYSLHLCCKPWNGIYETRYLYEMRSRLFCNDEKFVKHTGIKFVTGIEKCCPTEEIEAFFHNLKTE